MAATFREAKQFLKQFHQKKRRYGILFSKQGANIQELLNLEWSTKEREKIINGLKIEHWMAPVPEEPEEGEVVKPEEEETPEPVDEWIFQTVRRGKLIRIHLSLSLPEQPVICWVFGAVKS